MAEHGNTADLESPAEAEDERRYVTCQWCKKVEELHWYPDVEKYLLDCSLCFDCGFWLKYLMAAPSGYVEGQRIARMGGNHFVICPDTPGGFKGYGGHKFVIRFDNGDEVTTRNLWHQGEIPERFRSQLPDNAEDVTPPITFKRFGVEAGSQTGSNQSGGDNR